MNAWRASVAGVGVVAVVAACVGPTAISLDVTTNACGTLGQVDFYVGAPDAAFSAPTTSKPKGCASATGNEVGTLTLVPSKGIGDRLQIAVVGSLGSGACAEPSTATTDPTCIVARRELAYLPHSTLPLPIDLDSRCAGHACNPDQTCVVLAGVPMCVGSTCDTDGGVVCTIVDAGTDAGPCLEPVADAGAPTLQWSFDDRLDQQVHEDQDRVSAEAQLDGYFASDNATCGSYFNTTMQDQPLTASTILAVSTFTIAFDFKAPADSTFLKFTPTGGNGGYTISVLSGGLYVDFNGIIVGDQPNTVNDGAWHTFSMTVGNAGVTVMRDGQSFGSVTLQWPAQVGTLAIGASSTIDQVEFFTP